VSFTKTDLQSIIKSIRQEQSEVLESLDEDAVLLELASAQHCSCCTYVRTIQLHDSYCRLELVPEPLASYIDVEKNELLLPYTSIIGIEKQTKTENDDEGYTTYRLLTIQDVGYFYDVDSGYIVQKEETDPLHIETPGVTLSRIYGLLRTLHQKPT